MLKDLSPRRKMPVQTLNKFNYNYSKLFKQRVLFIGHTAVHIYSKQLHIHVCMIVYIYIYMQSYICIYIQKRVREDLNLSRKFSRQTFTAFYLRCISYTKPFVIA